MTSCMFIGFFFFFCFFLLKLISGFAIVALDRVRGSDDKWVPLSSKQGKQEKETLGEIHVVVQLHGAAQVFLSFFLFFFFGNVKFHSTGPTSSTSFTGSTSTTGESPHYFQCVCTC
jgi:hypothetical protein